WDASPPPVRPCSHRSPRTLLPPSPCSLCGVLPLLVRCELVRWAGPCRLFGLRTRLVVGAATLAHFRPLATLGCSGCRAAPISVRRFVDTRAGSIPSLQTLVPQQKA